MCKSLHSSITGEPEPVTTAGGRGGGLTDGPRHERSTQSGRHSDGSGIANQSNLPACGRRGGNRRAREEVRGVSTVLRTDGCCQNQVQGTPQDRRSPCAHRHVHAAYVKSVPDLIQTRAVTKPRLNFTILSTTYQNGCATEDEKGTIVLDM